MSDEKKSLPIFFARAEHDRLGPQLLRCADIGTDDHGRFFLQILKDHLSKSESRTDGDDLLLIGSEASHGNVAAHVIGIPAALAGSIIGMPLAPLAFLYGLFDENQYENRMVRLTVVNCFDQPLVVGPALMKHGDETAQCAIGTMSTDGLTFLPTSHRQIPAKQTIRVGSSSHDCYGVGMFLYERHTTAGIGFYGTEGALTFTCADPKFGPHTIGFAFVNGYAFDVRCALAGDMSQFGSLTADHFDATMAKFHSWSLEDAATRSDRAVASVWPDDPWACVMACFSGAVQTHHSGGTKGNEMVDFVIAFRPNKL